MAKPTMVECMMAVTDAFNEDFEKHPYNGKSMPIPIRAYGLVRESLIKAYKQAEEKE